MVKAICVDIGGTAIKFGMLEYNKNNSTVSIRNKHNVNWQPSEIGGRNLPRFVYNLIRNQLDSSIEFIGISTAGIVDITSGRIIYANDNIPNYTGVELKTELEKLTELPVWIDNDVNCAALAEHYQGHSQGSDISVCLTIGTGVGGALINKGELFRGSCYSAMEVGYIPMNDSTLENLASVTALIKRCEKRLGTYTNLTGKKIFELALKKNNKVCLEEIDRLIENLTEGMKILYHVVAPDTIVLGGGIMAQADYLIPKIQSSLNKKVQNNIKVIEAKHLNDAGMVGAFYHGYMSML